MTIPLRNTFFDTHGYLIADVLKDEKLTYPQAKAVISKRLSEIRQMIEDKESELSELRMYLSAIEHSDRTVWLLYKDKDFSKGGL